MKLSVVTIAYNQATFLERALRSIRALDWPEVELIVVDPGSTDGSREILAAWAGQIDRLILEPDDGPADGLNKGFAAATGDVFCYVNSDDMILPWAAREAIAAFEETGAAGVVGDGYVIDGEDRFLRRFVSDAPATYPFFVGGSYFMQQATFFTRAAFETVNGFNPANRICWDAELVLDIIDADLPVVHCPGRWGLWRVVEGTITSSAGFTARNEAEIDRMFADRRGRVRGRREALLKPLARYARFALAPTRTATRIRDVALGAPRQFSRDMEALRRRMDAVAPDDAANPDGAGRGA